MIVWDTGRVYHSRLLTFLLPALFGIIKQWEKMEKYSCVSQIISKLYGYGRQSNTSHPSNVHVLMSRACEYMVSHGRRDLANVMKDFEVGRLSWIISKCVQCNHKSPHKEEAEGSELEKEM